jgi:sulfoxide reductase heme-binding subunit YedZ
VNPQIWWYLARASGIVAWLMLTASVLWGIVLATDLFPRHRRPAWLLDLHRWLGGLTIFFLAGHLGALLADRHAHFRVVDVLVPFSSTWRPTAIAVGIVAAWLLLAVEGTALAMKRLSKKWWRDVHIASYWIFWGTCIHAALAGTDTSKILYAATSLVAVALVVFAASYRILSRDLPKRGPRRASRGADLRPTRSSVPATAGDDGLS